jgi:hypothetical protein
MWKFVTADGKVGANQTIQEHRLDFTASTFDPLVMASLMISDQALMAFGDYLYTRNYCPLCEVEQNLGRGLSTEWIDRNADTLLELCRERHLIAREGS